ncbi:zinc finger protein 12-like [Anastrepha obliqua]|uniref:zinc finger protein 12-like n=1 Tax=Anastrepha obliqua TaxID=95512 RepID=UPI00240A3C51|nr:zinc finger protein 12-like [Anastrepha obliqua]
MKTSLTEKWIVCRVCLKQPDEAMMTIFDKEDEKDMTHMILECGGVPIKRFDHYPDKICSRCLKYLRVAYKFRVTCQRSHKHLSRFIAPAVVETHIEDEVQDYVPIEGDEVEEIALKVEPDTDIKQEFSDSEGVEVLDIYVPIDEDAEEFEEFDTIDRSASTIFEGAEYLEETEEFKYSDDDEEYTPAKEEMPKRGRGRPPKNLRKNAASTSKQSENRQSAGIKKEKSSPVKRGPKPKKVKPTSYICDICGNIYPSQGRLTEHIKLHKGIKPHECEICGHCFAQTQQLTRHMNTHTGNRPYKCSYCPAAFADLSTRNKHHRIHTNERPYVCDVCGKSFTYTNTLKFHKMIHTGEKPHVCDICGKGFQQAYKLRNHKMTHERKGVGIKMEPIEVEALENFQEVNTAPTQVLEI